MRRIMAAALLSAAAWPLAAAAQDEDAAVYTVGRLRVTAQDRSGDMVGGSVVSGETIDTFQKTSLDEALDLVPGASASNTGGSRNERVIYIRGFDRLQTPLSIDGVRVFLPADNRIDFARFLTADVAEVQVSKGYVSVIDGPGALGGQVNIVTLKPTGPFEADIRATALLDRDMSQEGYLASARVGGVQGDFYFQGSASWLDRDHFTLSNDFVPTAIEDGGERINSATSDWRVNVKAGWTPNDTDEYSINYTQQGGEKNAPYHISTLGTRFWTWPYWDNSSLSFLSRTALGERMTLRSRLYLNTFDNLLRTFDDAAQTTQSLPRAFDSYYDDEAMGGNVELTVNVTDLDQLKLAFHARRDEHREKNDPGFINVGATPTRYVEPWQVSEEDTYAFAAENTLGIGEDVDLIVGAAYEWTDLRRADEVNVFVQAGAVVISPLSYPLRNASEVNGQAALVWRPVEGLSVHGSVSSRTRFPTLMERFSSRFGTSIPNPDIEPERATSYELGFKSRVVDGLKAEGAVFYSDLENALVLLPRNVAGFGVVNQTVNAASARFHGAELSLEGRISDGVTVGGNVTWIRRAFEFDSDPAQPAIPAFRPQGVPDVKAFLYAAIRPGVGFTVTPSLEIASDRWTVSVTNAADFYKTGDYVLANVAADWDVNETVRLSFGVQNLTDENYQLTDGFPEAGRSFYAGVRGRF